MIFTVTYREIFTDGATTVQEHTTTFEAAGTTEALATISGWMEHRSHRGGIVQVLNIDIQDTQKEPIKQEHEAIILA